MTASPVDTTTDLHAVIAALRAERDAAVSEKAALAEALATRNNEFGERIEQQSATIDVLKVMSASPGDPVPVFDLIANRARAFCEADGAMVTLLEGGMLHLRTHIGATQAASAAYEAYFPCPVDDSTTLGRAVRTRAPVHNPDILADPGYRMKAITSVNSVRSNAAVPILRGGVPIGAIGIAWLSVGEFPTAQLELLKTFAEQAVIAITSAETYLALQMRTADLQESLEYQTATSDVLNVISRSTFDLQPVLTMVAETAARLCAADHAVIIRHENGIIEMVANSGFPPEYEARLKKLGPHRLVADAPMVTYRAISERRVVHVHDVAAVSGYAVEPIELGQQRTSLGVPLMRAGEPIGSILLARRRVEPFTDRQIELVNTLANQAVIAIENTRLLTEQQEALEQQTATAEVLQLINASPGNLAPVFDAMLDRAMHLCDGAQGTLWMFDGDRMSASASAGYSSELAEQLSEWREMHPFQRRLSQGERVFQIVDLAAEGLYHSGNPLTRAAVDVAGIRTVVFVALVKDATTLGGFTIGRREVRAFTDKHIALLQTFAEQAVIAMENARLITEQREALEQQRAVADLLATINAFPEDLTPVFDMVLDKAHRVCEAALGMLAIFDGKNYQAVSTHGYPEQFAALVRRPVRAKAPQLALLRGDRLYHVPDLRAVEWSQDDQFVRNFIDLTGVRTYLLVPLRKDGSLRGFIGAHRREVRPFSDKEIALLENFAAQAVIAMENARLLDEIRRRQEELRITFENMGDGVAMFDGTQHLVAWNRKFQDILDVPDDIIASRQTFSEYVRYLAERGEYGADADVEEQVRRILETAGQMRAFERLRPNGRVIEVRSNPVAGGGFVLIYGDITERKRNEAEIRAARDAAEEASRTIAAAYRDLKAVQANLIQAEKMASLGQLTAGIAHEIKNPLNFVNNFAALSVDLLAELKETAGQGFAALSEAQRAEIDDVSAMLTSNLEKITEHGKRADGIVKAMLEHSRGSSGERRTIDMNALIDEALKLAYHGARAQDHSFNITLERDFGKGITPIEVNPQDITRVFLNIFSNGFYAANKRARSGEDSAFMPTLKVTTREAGEAVEILVRDNGTGIPADIRDKLFQPFFTTKPTGEGTGLGLSITYDIVTQAHGGSIAVESEVGEYSAFTIRLPRNP